MRFDPDIVYLLTETFKGRERRIAAKALIQLLRSGTPTPHEVQEIGASLRRDAGDATARVYHDLCRAVRLDSS